MVGQALAADLVRQPDVFRLLDDGVELGDFEDAWELGRVNRVAIVDLILGEEEPTHLNLDLGRRVESRATAGRLVFGLGELLERNFPARMRLACQPNDSTAAFSEQTYLLVALRASVPILGLFEVGEAPLFRGIALDRCPLAVSRALGNPGVAACGTARRILNLVTFPLHGGHDD